MELPWLRICKRSALGVLMLGGAALALMTAFSASSYQGHCFSLSFFGDAPRRACSRVEYMRDELPFTLAVLAFEFWWVPILAFTLFIGVGALVSLAKRDA